MPTATDMATSSPGAESFTFARGEWEPFYAQAGHRWQAEFKWERRAPAADLIAQPVALIRVRTITGGSMDKFFDLCSH